MSSILLIVAGLVVAFNGNRLFWLFAGLIGFLVGIQLAPALPFLREAPEAVRVAGAVVLGVVCALFSGPATRGIVAVIGFLAGAALALGVLPGVFGAAAVGPILAGSLAFGVVAAVVAASSVDWAVVALSSLAGAAAVMTGANALLNLGGGTVVWLGTLVLAMVAFGAQSRAAGRG